MNQVSQTHNAHKANTYKFIFLLVLIPILIWITNGFYIKELLKNVIIYYIFDLFSYVVIPCISLALLYKIYGLSPTKYGIDIDSIRMLFSKAKGSRTYNYKVAIKREVFIYSASIICVAYFLLWAIGYYFRLYDESIYKALDYEFSAVQKTIFVIYLSLTAALFEEVFYRGLMFYLLSISFQGFALKIIYIMMSSMLFSIAHFEYSSYEMIRAFFMGLIMSYVFYKYRDLFPLIFSHFMINVIAFS